MLNISIPTPKIPWPTTLKSVVIFSLILAVGFGSWLIWYEILSQSTPQVTIPSAPSTIVCGTFSAPFAVVGTPIATNDHTITFEDGYLLSLKDTPSIYLNKRAAFQVQEGIVSAYLLGQNGTSLPVDFNPCTPTVKP